MHLLVMYFKANVVVTLATIVVMLVIRWRESPRGEFVPTWAEAREMVIPLAFIIVGGPLVGAPILALFLALIIMAYVSQWRYSYLLARQRA